MLFYVFFFFGSLPESVGFLDHNHFPRSIKKATYPQSWQMYARGNEIPTVLSVHFSCQFCYLSAKFSELLSCLNDKGTSVKKRIYLCLIIKIDYETTLKESKV